MKFHTFFIKMLLPILILTLFFRFFHGLDIRKQFPISSVQAAGEVAWSVFDGDPQKSGNNANEPIINKTNITTLKQLWQASVSSDGSPVYLSGVTTPQGVKNLVYVTTTNGTLIAIDEATGMQVWNKSTSGSGGVVTSSPAIDPGNQFIYSYGKDGKVHKYDVGTGNEETAGNWPLVATLIPNVEKGSSALAISNNYLYVTTSAYPGDNGNYVGHIVAKNLATGTVSVFNTLCANNNQLLNGNCGSRQSGVWSRPGAVVDPNTGNIFVASGNGPYNPPNDLGDSLIELAPDLSKVLDTYTPTSFQQLYDQDEDLGSTLITIIPGLELGIQGGKDNKIRVVNLKNLSGQGTPYHTGGELQTLSVDCNIFSQPISWVNGSTTWVFVTDMCNNLYAYTVVNNQLQQAYKNSGDGGSSPLMVNGILFIQANGAIKALDPTTGNLLWSGQVGTQHWQSPAVINGHIFVLDSDGKLTAFGLPNTPTNTLTTPTTIPPATSTPQATTAPTNTPPALTTANVSIKLEGIGSGTGENKIPLHTTRTLFISLYNLNTKQLYGNADTVKYDGSNLFTNTNFSLGALPSGTYQVLLKANQHITGTTAQTIAITAGTPVTIQNVLLAAGDIAPFCMGDNCVNDQDQQMMQTCITQTNTCTTACPNKLIADVNDDGKVDATDQALVQKNIGVCGASTNTTVQNTCVQDPACNGFNICALKCGVVNVPITP